MASVGASLPALGSLRSVLCRGVGGLSTLSADARCVIGPQGASFSLYKPENGAAATLFLGRHLKDYLSLQADYGWNRNDLTLSATAA